MLVDRVNGRSKLWQEVFDWSAPECRGAGCEGYRRFTQDFLPGQPRSEVSAHPIAFPALLALLVAPLRPGPETVERYANLAIQGLAWLGVLVTYAVGRAAGFGRGPALLGAGLLGLASPWLAYSRSFYAELPAGLFLVLGLWGLQRGKPIVTGIAAGVAFMLKPPFLVFGALWCVERLWAGRPREALHVAAPLAGLGAIQVVFNLVAARRLVISGTGPWVWADGLGGLHGQLFDPAHGILPFAPWVLLALLAVAMAFRRDPRASLLARQVALPTLPYVALISANAYLGQTCYGPRYWVALLPLLALLAVDCVRSLSAQREAAITLALLATLGAYVAIPGAFYYPELWDQPALAVWAHHR